MEVKVSYSKIQLENAVEYIATKNVHFLGQRDTIRGTILKYIKEIVISTDPEYITTGTMGFLIIVNKVFESFDNDQNTAEVEIWIDPSLCVDNFEWHEEIMRGP